MWLNCVVVLARVSFCWYCLTSVCICLCLVALLCFSGVLAFWGVCLHCVCLRVAFVFGVVVCVLLRCLAFVGVVWLAATSSILNVYAFGAFLCCCLRVGYICGCVFVDLLFLLFRARFDLKFEFFASFAGLRTASTTLFFGPYVFELVRQVTTSQMFRKLLACWVWFLLTSNSDSSRKINMGAFPPELKRSLGGDFASRQVSFDAGCAIHCNRGSAQEAPVVVCFVLEVWDFGNMLVWPTKSMPRHPFGCFD